MKEWRNQSHHALKTEMECVGELMKNKNVAGRHESNYKDISQPTDAAEMQERISNFMHWKEGTCR